MKSAQVKTVKKQAPKKRRKQDSDSLHDERRSTEEAADIIADVSPQEFGLDVDVTQFL